MVKPKDCGIDNEAESSFSLCLVPELVDKKAFKEGNNNPNYMMAGTLYIPKNLMEVVTSGPARTTSPRTAQNVFSYGQEVLNIKDPEVKELMGELCSYSKQDRTVTIVALREALAKIRSTISVDSFEDEKTIGSPTKSNNLAEQKYNIMGKVMKFWGDRKPKEAGRRMDKVKTNKYFPKVESDKSVELFNAGPLSAKASGASVPADEILKPAKNQQVKEADPNTDVILNWCLHYYNFMRRKIYLKYDIKKYENSKNLLKLQKCEDEILIYGCRAIENISMKRCIIKGNEKKHGLHDEKGNGENCVMPLKDVGNSKLDIPDYLLYDENFGKGGRRSWRTLGVSDYSNEDKELTSYLTQWHTEYSTNEYVVMSSQENWSNNYRKYEAFSALQKQKLNEKLLHVKKRNFLDCNFLFDHHEPKKENNLPFPNHLSSNFHKTTNKNGKHLFNKSLYLSPSFLQHNWNSFIPHEQTVAYQNDSTREIIVTPPQRSTSDKMIKSLERPKCRIEIKGEGYRGKFNVGLDPELDEAIYKSIQTIREKCRKKHYKREASRKHSTFICDLTDRLKRKLVCKRHRKRPTELVEDDDDDSDIYVCKPLKGQIGSSGKKFLVYKNRKGSKLSKPNESDDEDIFIPISSDVRQTGKKSRVKESGNYVGSKQSTRVPVSSPSVIDRGRRTSRGMRESLTPDEEEQIVDMPRESVRSDSLRREWGRTSSLKSDSERRPSGQMEGDSFTFDEEGEIVRGQDWPSLRDSGTKDWLGSERGRTISLKPDRDRRHSGQVEETTRKSTQEESARITGKPKEEDSTEEEISEEEISEEEIISAEGFGKRTTRQSKRISFKKADMATSISDFPEEMGDKTRQPSEEKKFRTVTEEKTIIEEELPGGEIRTTEKITIREESSSEEVSSSNEQLKVYEGPKSIVDQDRRTKERKEEERRTRDSRIQTNKSKHYEGSRNEERVRDSKEPIDRSLMGLRTFRSKDQPRKSKLSSQYKSSESERVTDDEEKTEEKSTSYRRSVDPSYRNMSGSTQTEEKSTSYRRSVVPSYRKMSGSTQTEEKSTSYRRSVDPSYRNMSGSTQTEEKSTSYRRSVDPSYRNMPGSTQTEEKSTSYRRSVDPSYRKMSGSTQTEEKSTSYRRSVDPSYRNMPGSTQTEEKSTSYRRSVDPSYRKMSGSTQTEEKSTSYRRSVDPSYRKMSGSTQTEEKSTSYTRSVDPSYRTLSERIPTEEKWTSYRRSVDPSDGKISGSKLTEEKSTSYRRSIDPSDRILSESEPIDNRYFSKTVQSDRRESDEMPSLHERSVEEILQEKVQTKDESTEYERSIREFVEERRKLALKILGSKSIDSVLERSRESTRRPLEERSTESILEEYGKSSMKPCTDEERRKSKISLSDVGRSIDSIIEERKTFARRTCESERSIEFPRERSTPSYADRSLGSISEESRTMTPSDVDPSGGSRESKEDGSSPVVHIKYYQPPSDSHPEEFVTGDVTLKPISKVSLEKKIEESQRVSGIIHVSRPEEKSEEDKRISGTINITRSAMKPEEEENVSADIRIKSLGKSKETGRGISQKKDERSVDSSISEICSLERKCRDMGVRFDMDKEDCVCESQTSVIDDGECTCITPRRGMSGDTGYIPGTGEPTLSSERRMQRRHSRFDPGTSYSGSGFGYIPCPYRSRRGDHQQSFNDPSRGSNHSSRRYRGYSGRGVSFYNSPNQGTSSSSSYSRSNSRGRSQQSNNGSRQFDVHGYSPSQYCQRVAVNSDDELTDDFSNTTIAMPLLYYPFFNSDITISKRICKKRPMSEENICEKSSDFNLYSSKSFTAFYKVQKSMNCYYMQLDSTSGELKKKSCLKVKTSFCNICKKPIKKRPSSPCKPKNMRPLCQKSDFLEKSEEKKCCYSNENSKKTNICSSNACHRSRDKKNNRNSCSNNKNDSNTTKVSDLEGATWDFFGLINNECSGTDSKNPCQHQPQQNSCRTKPKCCCKKEPKRCNCIKQRTCCCKKKKSKVPRRCDCKKPEPCQCCNKKKKSCSRETCPKRSGKACRGRIHGSVESAFDEGICPSYGRPTYDKSQGVAFRPGGTDYQQQYDSNCHFLGSGKRQDQPKRLSRCPELMPTPLSSNLLKSFKPRPRSASPRPKMQKQHSLLSLKTFRSPTKPSGHRARSASPHPRYLRKPMSLMSLKSFRPSPSASTSKMSNKIYNQSLLGTQSDYSSKSQQILGQKRGLSQHSLDGFSSTGQTRSRNGNQSDGYHEHLIETYIASPSPDSICLSPSQISPRQESKPSLNADSSTEATVPTYLMQSNCMSPFSCQNTCDPCSSVYSRRPPDSHPFFCEQEPYRRCSPARTEPCPNFKKRSSCKPDSCKPDPCAPCPRRSPCFSADPCPSCPPRSSCPPCPQRSCLADPCPPRSSCFTNPCSPRSSCNIDPCLSCSRSCCLPDPCLPSLPRSPCSPDPCSPCSPLPSCCPDPCSSRSSCMPCPSKPSCLPCSPRPSCLPDPCPPCLPRSSCLPDPCSSCSPRSSCFPDSCPSRASCIIDPCPPCLPRSPCKPDPCSPCPPRSFCKPDPCCSSITLCKTESFSTPRSSCKPDPCSPYPLSACRPDPCSSGSGRSILKKANKYHSCMNNLNCSNNSSKECFSRQYDDCKSSSSNCCRSNYQSALRRMSSNCCYEPPKCCLKPCGSECGRDSSSDNCCSPSPCRPTPNPCCSIPRSQRSKAFQDSADNCNEKCPPNFSGLNFDCRENNDLCKPCETSNYTPKKDWSRAKKYLSKECLQDDVGQNTSNPSPSRYNYITENAHKKSFSMFKKGKSKYDPNKGRTKKISILGDDSGNSIPIKPYCSPSDCSTTCNSCMIPDFNCCDRRKQYETCGADNPVSRHMASSWKKWSGFNTTPCTVAENVSIMDKYIDTDAKKRRNPGVKYGVSFSPSTLESDCDSDLKGKFKTNTKRKKCPSSSRKSTMAVNYCGSDSCEDSPPPSWSRKSHYNNMADYQSLCSPTCNDEVTKYPSWTTESTKRSTIAVNSNPYRIDKRCIDDDTCISAWRKVSKTELHSNEEYKKTKKCEPINKWSLKSFRRIPQVSNYPMSKDLKKNFNGPFKTDCNPIFCSQDMTCAMFPWNDSCCYKSRPKRKASTWGLKVPSEIYNFDNSFPDAVGSSSTSKSCWNKSTSPSSFLQGPGGGTTYPQKKNIWMNDAQTVMFSTTVDNVGSQHLWEKEPCEVKNESCKPGLMAFLNEEVNSSSSTSDQSLKSKLILGSSSDLTTTSAESVYSKRPSAISVNSSPLSSDISGPKCFKKRSHSKVVCPVIKTDTFGCEPNGSMSSASFSKRERKSIFDKSKRKPLLCNDDEEYPASFESLRNSTEESIFQDPSCSIENETNENICENPKNTLFRVGSSCNENRASEFYGSKRKKSLCRWSGSLSD